MPDNPPVAIGTRVAVGDDVYEFRRATFSLSETSEWCGERLFTDGALTTWVAVDIRLSRLLDLLAAQTTQRERADQLLKDADPLAACVLACTVGELAQLAIRWRRNYLDYRLCPTTPPPSPSTPSP